MIDLAKLYQMAGKGGLRASELALYGCGEDADMVEEAAQEIQRLRELVADMYRQEGGLWSAKIIERVEALLPEACYE